MPYYLTRLAAINRTIFGIETAEAEEYIKSHGLSIAPSLELKNPEFRHIMSYRIPVHEKT